MELPVPSLPINRKENVNIHLIVVSHLLELSDRERKNKEIQL
jgi:hypothetical protein